MPSKRADIVIGIDPGVQTGYAAWSRHRKQFTELLTLSFWAAYDRVTSFGPSEIEIVIENPDSKRAMYNRTESVIHARQRERLATNIGSNRREASLLIERFQSLGYNVRAVSPIKERKWDAEQFRRLTKYKGSTSQHVRDAGRLVFGM
jgi:hypothetical protein